MVEHPEFAAMATSHLLRHDGERADRFNPVSGAMVAYRLVELQCSPIRGGFDAAHLQNIHHYLHQDLYEWAGELRSVDLRGLPASDLDQSLDRILDRLASENHLRGLGPEDWSGRTSEYLYELEALQPFQAGTGVSLREFATELAGKNQMSLQWDRLPSIENTFAVLQQQAQSANLRRIIMLAMDREPKLTRPHRGDRQEHGMEKLLPFTGSLL